MPWLGARDGLKDLTVQATNRLLAYSNETKDSLGRYAYEHRRNDAINWDERLEKDISTLEHNLNVQCMFDFREQWKVRLASHDYDEEKERQIKPFADKAEAMLVEWKDNTIEGLKQRRSGFSSDSITDWHYEYERAMDDLADWVADMNDDINDGSDSDSE
ncbi:hypothetical protein PMG11_03373 [Penicillium brasilianum]|uniref:Uncharacterized protein n=1 Tax=Penicillium brasilianum TaxID=104259 RepID=A0A0F7VDC1_PENBI|nr:hypothetical protein PMG11_03373 [Penicillium brasilianum]